MLIILALAVKVSSIKNVLGSAKIWIYQSTLKKKTVWI